MHITNPKQITSGIAPNGAIGYYQPPEKPQYAMVDQNNEIVDEKKQQQIEKAK